MRHSTAMAYDAGRREVVLFGGRLESTDTNETWVWNGASWTQRFPAAAPARRHGHGMAYDRLNGEVVLYAGYNESESALFDTWTWNGVNWTPRASTAHPAWNTPVNLAWDPVGEQVLLYNGAYMIWAWKNYDWRLIGTFSSGPSWRRGSANTWDPISGRLLVFGGNTTLNDSWLWSPSTGWSLLPNPSPPEGRYVHSLALDPYHGKALLFGGHNYTLPPGSQFFNDTWLWSGSAWVRQTPAHAPAPRWKAAMAGDEARRQTVLFGGNSDKPGLGDTWVWPYTGLPDPAINASASPTAVVTGTATTYTLELRNAGAAPALDVQVQLLFPGGITGCSGPGCTDFVPVLAAGETRTFRHAAMVGCEVPDAIRLRADVRIGAALDGDPTNDNAAAIVTSVNPPPTLTAPAAISATTGPAATACGVNLPYLGQALASDNCPGVTTGASGVPSGNFFPVGTTPVTWRATDSGGASTTAMQNVTVTDNTPPQTGPVSVDKPVLWPVNHEMVLVTLAYTASDNCAANPACTLTVTSNEPLNGTGDGNTAADYRVVDSKHAYLRAERSGGGNGRIYGLTVRCLDAAGNASVRSAAVTVPKSQGK